MSYLFISLTISMKFVGYIDNMIRQIDSLSIIQVTISCISAALARLRGMDRIKIDFEMAFCALRKNSI